ncbi:MAG: nuclease [Proteobacteria bacterium]|nr:nuclease [Pseudomonadota bacterium]MCP4916927.1 nuclease [Pseudomonadota bacterium]
MLLLIACATKAPPAEAPAAVVESAPTSVSPTPTAEYPSTLFLDGVEVLASWDDGDTFASPRDGEKPLRARLSGFNTLESYGPVHSWGTWRPDELYVLSKKAGEVAGAGKWTCEVLAGGGGYGRERVDCPDLRRELLSRGLAHLFVFDGEADPDDMAAQALAIESKLGMWEKGAPMWLVTSLHSLDEREDQVQTYNRVAHTGDGHVEKRMHVDIYTSCSEVCPEAVDSCMIYVPYEVRYGDDRAACLQ